MSKAILQLVSLHKSFGGLKVTDGISMALHSGEIHALIGPNGAGKTTLISQIAGNIKPESGSVFLAGKDITHLSVAARAQKGLGRCFQVSSLAMSLSVRRNVMVAAQSVSGSSFSFFKQIKNDIKLIKAADLCISHIGLSGKEEVIVAELSHGERRKVEIACALALQPKVLLLDEPMAGLGSSGSKHLGELLNKLKHIHPILIVEHDMDMVFQLADKVSVLVYGRIIAQGTVDSIRRNKQVKKAYLGD